MLFSRNKIAGEKPRRFRRWVIWLADLMIVAGVLTVAYTPATWLYTWYEQRGLRAELIQSSPALTAKDTNPTIKVDPAAAAEALRQAELAKLRSAAQAFETGVSGKTGKAIGEIIIPSINLDVVMVEGTGKGDLKEGPGHWPETPFPGEGGNFVVSGHRTTYGHPFYYLNRVKLGDEIKVVLPYAICYYKVTDTFVCYPNEVDKVASTGIEQVSLAACHPIYSAKQRIVVKGDLVSYQLVGDQKSASQSNATTTTGLTAPTTSVLN